MSAVVSVICISLKLQTHQEPLPLKTHLDVRPEIGGEREDRSLIGLAAVARANAEKGVGGPRVVPDTELSVEEQHGNVGAFEQVLQVKVGSDQLPVVLSKIGVDRLQFLVTGQ